VGHSTVYSGLGSISSNGAILTGYDFTDPITGTGFLGASVTDAAVLASAFTGNAGFADINTPVVGDTSGFTVDGTVFGSTAVAAASALTGGSNAQDANGGSLAGAITAGDYTSFTINAAAGSTLSLDSLSFQSSIAGPNAAETFSILAVTDGSGTFTAADQVFGAFTTTGLRLLLIGRILHSL